ncbi:MAG TPA: hypothetical protein PLB59_04155 [Bacteroidales bacterium]|jgi:predicted component of type VI protein secretion system|nr:hypothetical protein [Bacteroidales bacterium]HPB24870.1 hypothetical protein [Bacteroidales bacterium]HPI29502.1 hypothetical protein [Bacteroidales bacterium]HQN15603.1 hypothetical protein [Bacteroidales bacterium]HQP15139.1 hypothetical protein [Bacteroidales bacterium]
MNPAEIATKSDIEDLKELIQKLIQTYEIRLDAAAASQVYTVNQLVKSGTLGGYDKIKTLIRTGKLHTTPGGQISQKAINDYLKNK